jgi:hypothetical protein
MKIEWKREIMKDVEKRHNVFFATFYKIVDGLLMLLAAWALVSKIDSFHTARGAVAFLICVLTMLGTTGVMLAIFGVLGQSALVWTVVENK